MKKIISFIASLTALLLVLTACSSKTETKKEEKKEPVTVKVASHFSNDRHVRNDQRRS